MAEETVVDEEAAIGSLKDPFSLKGQVPELFKFFMKGVEQLNRKEAVVEKKVQPTVPVKVKAPAPTPVPAPVVPKVPPMSVTGVLYAGKDSQAIINGQVVGQGDMVDGVKILGISKGRIDIRYMDIDRALYFSGNSGG